MSGSSEKLPASSHQLPAASSQLPDFPQLAKVPDEDRVGRVSTFQLLHEARQHPPDLLELSGQLLVHLCRQEPEISGKKEIILKFIAGTQGMPQKPAEIWIRAPAGPFCDIRRDRDCRPKHLIPYWPRVWLLKVRRNCVRRERQVVSFLPHSQISIVLH